jgi:hypothetical protein
MRVGDTLEVTGTLSVAGTLSVTLGLDADGPVLSVASEALFDGASELVIVHGTSHIRYSC